MRENNVSFKRSRTMSDKAFSCPFDPLWEGTHLFFVCFVRWKGQRESDCCPRNLNHGITRTNICKTHWNQTGSSSEGQTHRSAQSILPRPLISLMVPLWIGRFLIHQVGRGGFIPGNISCFYLFISLSSSWQTPVSWTRPVVSRT